MLLSSGFLTASSLLGFCNFDKTPTPAIIVFEGFILAATVLCWFVLSKVIQQFWLRFLLMSVGVLIFELFTSPMWHNYRMGIWAYVYQDVSWILTLGWTSLILSVVVFTDRWFASWKEWKRFPIYLGILTLIGFLCELIVVNIGIRGYAPQTLAALSGIQLAGVPIEALYYIPVFMTLVICFYKYWSFVLVDDQPLVPLKHRKWGRSFLLAFLAIFLFEVMIEPMVKNAQFPTWSYIFHDITVVMTGIWILIVGLAAAIVGRFFAHYTTPWRFLIALGITGAVALPVEAWLIHHSYRIYQENVVHQYLGYTIPGLNVPIELVFGTLIYMALVIVFIRYWETVIDNRI